MDQMKKILIYYPFKLREQKSGSAVRPVKMLEAFEQLGRNMDIEVIKIHGTAQERKEQLDNLYKHIDPLDILFCYMENATIPIWLTDPDHVPRKPFLDVKFFHYLKENSIPLGVFYRDIYWKFNELYHVNKIVRPIMQTLFKMELSVYKKYASAFFLPSLYMNEYLGISNSKVVPLPPGGVDLLNLTLEDKSQKETVHAIYVGGIHPRYGIYEVLEAFQKLNQNTLLTKLLLVCRKEEFQKYENYFQPYMDCNWLEIFHAYGDDLIPIYKRADYGIVPIKKDIYNDFAVAVKMFEYLSFGLPIVATNCNAQKDLVEEGQFGAIVEDHTDSILNGLKIMTDENVRMKYKENAIKSLKQHHLWLHRAEKVFNTLIDRK
jgi:glycosyltransferase involved in cell wall biosynthesis